MTKYSPAQTTRWVADNVSDHDDVLKIEVVSDQVIKVYRQKHDPFFAGIVSAKCVAKEVIEELVKSDFDIDIIVNIPKDAIWVGEAINFAEDNSIATGSYGDLLRVIHLDDVRSYLPRERKFIERGLRQHDRITRFVRLYDNVYKISRRGLPDLTVAMLYEYELTADALRTARDRYGAFSIAVITNPNGSATSSASDVAKNIGVSILKWGEFFGRLNKP
ncbi:MAG: hypothetical protein ACF8MF_05875 [Phycisphaerales bacterium JB052]